MPGLCFVDIDNYWIALIALIMQLMHETRELKKKIEGKETQLWHSADAKLLMFGI